MTAINLDDQIVATSYEAQNRVCSYTYQHTDGSRYTVKIPIDDLHMHGRMPQSAAKRRVHLAQHIQNHIRTNPPDDHVRPHPRAVEAVNPDSDNSKAGGAG